MAENLKKSIPDETNLTKLQSNKNDSLSPVRLCPSLYSEVLRNYMLLDPPKRWPQQSSVEKIIKFGMIGKEAWNSIVSSFQRVNALHLSHDAKFCSREIVRFISGEFMKLLADEIPILEQFVIDREWLELEGRRKCQNYFFEVLSADSNEKELEINGLKEVDDLAKMTLKKLVENGVMIIFGFNEIFKIEIYTEFNDHDYYVKECLDEMIEAVEDAPQNQVALNIVIDFIESRSDLPQEFICKDEDEYCHNFEWESQSNENKIIKLEVSNVDSDYDSPDDYDYDS
uniref:DUF4378 domain-containing protein n=1 Tax=Panagrolaimus sp. JU765 TaxID=591449 RepID=A0AC34RPZ3_9BILA